MSDIQLTHFEKVMVIAHRILPEFFVSCDLYYGGSLSYMEHSTGLAITVTGNAIIVSKIVDKSESVDGRTMLYSDLSQLEHLLKTALGSIKSEVEK